MSIVWLIMFLVILGLWRLIERVFTLFDNRFLCLGLALLSSAFYIIAFIGLDFYVLKIVLAFTTFEPLDLGYRLFTIALIAIILMERTRWIKAREKAQIDNLTLQAENIETTFKLLREQVNPEFLFHCLTTLQTMAKTDDPQAEDYLLKLADVYRQTLKKDKNVVDLREELSLLQTYMYLMRYGRESAVFFEINVSEASLNYKLPVFALQLLGDNCIKHNEFSDSQPLHIYVFQKDPLSITMENNYQQRVIPKSYGIDIEHLEMRYAIEGIENAVLIDKGQFTYSITLKLFNG
jgi:two-component system, LytTR family, sensor kinase